MKILTKDESYAIQCALECAAKQYAELEQQARASHEEHVLDKTKPTGFLGLAEQFKRQRELADKLADLVAEYDGVALHNDNDMLAQTYSRYGRG